MTTDLIVRQFRSITSRKEYVCKVCHKKIQKGILYLRHYTQGERHAVVMHEDCHDKQLMFEVFQQ